MWTQWDGGCCISAAVRTIWKTSHIPDFHADFYEHSMHFHWWRKCMVNVGDFGEKWYFVVGEFALLHSIIVSLYLLVVSIEINRIHYFQSDLRTLLFPVYVFIMQFGSICFQIICFLSTELKGRPLLPAFPKDMRTLWCICVCYWADEKQEGN